ncbi:hypothetical protein OH77DRAFT_1513189 [Trametes cingulata]|nr:hypothetical protein OH77DRAFT_1513189 [Trametes cingulata]
MTQVLSTRQPRPTDHIQTPIEGHQLAQLSYKVTQAWAIAVPPAARHSKHMCTSAIVRWNEHESEPDSRPFHVKIKPPPIETCQAVIDLGPDVYVLGGTARERTIPVRSSVCLYESTAIACACEEYNALGDNHSPARAYVQGYKTEARMPGLGLGGKQGGKSSRVRSGSRIQDQCGTSGSFLAHASGPQDNNETRYQIRGATGYEGATRACARLANSKAGKRPEGARRIMVAGLLASNSDSGTGEREKTRPCSPSSSSDDGMGLEICMRRAEIDGVARGRRRQMVVRWAKAAVYVRKHQRQMGRGRGRTSEQSGNQPGRVLAVDGCACGRRRGLTSKEGDITGGGGAGGAEGDGVPVPRPGRPDGLGPGLGEACGGRRRGVWIGRWDNEERRFRGRKRAGEERGRWPTEWERRQERRAKTSPEFAGSSSMARGCTPATAQQASSRHASPSP